ncbi:MAG: mechanosensitive ion channel family protein [Chthoniobacterales bacterium]
MRFRDWTHPIAALAIIVLTSIVPFSSAAPASTSATEEPSATAPEADPAPNFTSPIVDGALAAPNAIEIARDGVVKIERSLMDAARSTAKDLLPANAYETLTRTLLYDITPLRLVVSLTILIVVVALRFLLHWLFRSFLRRQDPSKPRTPLSILVKAAHRPTLLALWSYGLYAAAAPLLVPIGDPTLLNVAGVIADLIGLWAICGFVFRLVNLLYARAAHWAAKSPNRFERVLIPLAARYLRVFIFVVALLLTLPILNIAPQFATLVKNGASLLIIGVIVWMLIQATSAVESLILAGYKMDEADNLKARRVYTQVHVLRKVVITVLVLLGLASMLMVFPSVRQFGTSILASAGIAGIILGIAAQKSLANFIAGFQIAITQPIRIEDAVVVEGEWGWIEEVTLSYVVVRIWDWRRLVLPITYFVEKPFQNWTRTSGNILGSVFLYVDYSIPLDALRAKLDEVLEGTNLWDRRAKVLQVTDSREHDIEIRILCSGKDSPTTWDLRCHVREKLIEFIRDEYPESLPRLRARLDGPRSAPWREGEETPTDGGPTNAVSSN